MVFDPFLGVGLSDCSAMLWYMLIILNDLHNLAIDSLISSLINYALVKFMQKDNQKVDFDPFLGFVFLKVSVL